jgi:PhnB protein
MAVKLNPYLNCRGTAREAMTFYREVFGGEIRISSFRDFGQAEGPDDPEADLVMHAQLDTEGGLTLMGSDVPSRMEFSPGVNDFSVSLSGEDEAELTGYFDSLSQGGHVLMPLQTASWGDSFGMVRDRFGVTWLVNITARRDQ